MLVTKVPPLAVSSSRSRLLSRARFSALITVGEQLHRLTGRVSGTNHGIRGTAGSAWSRLFQWWASSQRAVDLEDRFRGKQAVAEPRCRQGSRDLVNDPGRLAIRGLRGRIAA